MITSTKFWTNIAGMFFSTVVICWLIHVGRFEYVNYYFVLMGAQIGVFTGLKTIQNLNPKGNGGSIS